MKVRLRELVRDRKSFAFETTLAARSYAPWLKDARSQGYSVHIVFLALGNADLAVQRVKGRVMAGGHDIREDVIRRRYNRGIENFRWLYRRLATAWVVYDNSSFRGLRLIARGSGQSETIYDPQYWASFEGSK